MKSFSVLRNLTSIALTACCAIGVSSAHAQNYRLTDLGVLPNQKDNNSTAAAINGHAQVAGTSGASAFRYTSSNKTPMEDVGGNPPQSISRGFGINGASLVVGDSTFGPSDVSHAAIFSNGSATNLGTLKSGGLFSRANGINAVGQVVGYSSDKRDGGNSRAFIVTTFLSPSMIDIGTLGGAYAQALGINDSGFVTGNSQTISSSTSVSTHAFMWHAGAKMLDLGTLDGDFSYGTSINANNHVVGYSTINTFDNRVHAFLHDGTQMIDLGSLGGASLDSDRSFALGVNATDQVVGYSYLPAGFKNTPLGPWPVAFVYRQGLMANLNDLIGTAANNYRLDSATAINDNGQIVAVAFDTSSNAFHAVLLTPIADVTPTIQITGATYTTTEGFLTVTAVCAGGAAGPMAPTLSVYVSSTKELIGNLNTKGNGDYFGYFSMKSSPQTITVVSSNGARADALVVYVLPPNSLKGINPATTSRVGPAKR
jgi:probable HAF family extracellular repeat protein